MALLKIVAENPEAVAQALSAKIAETMVAREPEGCFLGLFFSSGMNRFREG